MKNCTKKLTAPEPNMTEEGRRQQTDTVTLQFIDLVYFIIN